ncbi:uncharacterized protein LOC142349568 isoform X2 [Convolutriloba macropyga]|uniref:uncharacterized protein LOC142349568 isoform X2 n=1 Tax=Convolutriloba macropyga TaxID=536237 RepID=UPI003F51E477
MSAGNNGSGEILEVNHSTEDPEVQLAVISRLSVSNIIACKTFSFCNWFAACAMQLSYSALGLDRVLALYMPFSYRNWTRKHALVSLAAVTAVSGLSSIIPVFGYGIMESTDEEASDGEGDTFCKALMSAESLVSVVSYLVNMSIPVALVVVFNCMIVVALVRKRNKISSTGNGSLAGDIQLSVYLLGVTVFFSFTVISSNVLFNLLYVPAPIFTTAISTLLYCINSIINAAFYLHNPTMRKCLIVFVTSACRSPK